MSENSARIISLVPSWTETLVSAGLSVVGRTRFCIHPENRVRNIVPLGGTKGVDLKRLIALRPDFVVMDREENKKEVADALKQAGIQLLVSQVVDFKSVIEFLNQMAKLFVSERLKTFANRYEFVQNSKVDQNKFLEQIKIAGDWKDLDFSNLEYVIWKNPFMTIGKLTFIAATLRKAGLELISVEKYPRVSEEYLMTKSCLLSSEPYSFQSEFLEMKNQGYKAVLVDGEKISWYGIRNLSFLESCLE